jgi:Pacifastin inhibitor (LCMII)/Kazal-type serine protease inhibitor domain
MTEFITEKLANRGRAALFAITLLLPLGMGVRQCEPVVVGGPCHPHSAGPNACVCDYAGDQYAAGDSFKSSDSCNDCTCQRDGAVVCTKRACVQPICGGLLGAACPSDKQYCDFPEDALCGAADATGVCETKPEVCPEIYQPVCGCDDKTYGNACEAAMAGVSVAKSGECEVAGCDYEGKHYAPGDSFPAADGCNNCSCQQNGRVVCTLRACVAICGGLAGFQCADGQYCNYPIDALCGAADATGTCLDKPELCTANFDPVCGCDGKTYGNSCEAAKVGVAVSSKGECK